MLVISIFSPDKFQINLNYITFLSTVLSCSLDIGWHMWQSCLLFFLLFCYCVNICRINYFHIFTCWHTLLACLTIFGASGGMISPTILLYRSTIDVLSQHKIAGDEVSFQPVLRIRSCIDLPIGLWPCLFRFVPCELWV